MSNRLQGVLAGVAYSLLSGRTIFIDWRDSLYGQAGENSFPHYFELADLPTTAELPVSGQVYPSYWSDKLECPAAVEYLFDNNHMSPANTARTSIDFQRLDYTARVLVAWTWRLRPTLAMAGQLRQRVSYLNIDDDRKLLGAMFRRHVKVRADILKRVEDFRRNYFKANKMAGIHVRYTDMKSPLEDFIAKARSLHEEGLGLFLSTDNIQVQRLFEKLFPQLCCTDKFFPAPGLTLHSHYTELDNLEKGRQALVDMFLLGGCDVLVRSGKSSFTEIPALYYDLPPERIINLS